MPKYELKYDLLNNGEFTGPHFKLFDAPDLMSGRKLATEYIKEVENNGNIEVTGQRITEYKDDKVFGEEHRLEDKVL